MKFVFYSLNFFDLKLLNWNQTQCACVFLCVSVGGGRQRGWGTV